MMVCYAIPGLLRCRLFRSFEQVVISGLRREFFITQRHKYQIHSKLQYGLLCREITIDDENCCADLWIGLGIIA